MVGSPGASNQSRLRSRRLPLLLPLALFLSAIVVPPECLLAQPWEKAAPKSSAPRHGQALPPGLTPRVHPGAANHKCRIRACCHPERSEGPLLWPQRPLASLGVTVAAHPSAIVGTRPLSASPSPLRPVGWRGRGRSRR